MKTRLEFLGISVLLCAAVVFAAGGEKVKQVQSSYVCMITNKQFKTEQKAVTIEGKNYYYCCQGCKDTLQSDAKSRMATDPVSGKEVDKAVAAIGVDKEGNVYFFENAQNLAKFRTPKSK